METGDAPFGVVLENCVKSKEYLVALKRKRVENSRGACYGCGGCGKLVNAVFMAQHTERLQTLLVCNGFESPKCQLTP